MLLGVLAGIGIAWAGDPLAPETLLGTLAPSEGAEVRLVVGSTRLPPFRWESVEESGDDHPIRVWLGREEYRVGRWPFEGFGLPPDPVALLATLGALRQRFPASTRLHLEVDPELPAAALLSVAQGLHDSGFVSPIGLHVGPEPTYPVAGTEPELPARSQPRRTTAVSVTPSGTFRFEGVDGLGQKIVYADQVLGFEEDCRRGNCVAVLVTADARYFLRMRPHMPGDPTHYYLFGHRVRAWEGSSLQNAVAPGFQGVLMPFLGEGRPAGASKPTPNQTDHGFSRDLASRAGDACVHQLPSGRAFAPSVYNGDVVFEISVGVDGAVTDVKLTTELDDSYRRYETCMVRELKRTGLARPANGKPYLYTLRYRLWD